MKVQNNVQTRSDIQIMRATRRLKAQTSYFLTRIFLGTIVVPMVPQNYLHSIQFLNKTFTLTYKWNNEAVWYPVVPKMFTNQKFTIWTFPRRIDHPYSLPRSKLTKFETFMILFNLKVFTKMWIFALKIRKNLETSTQCANTPRYLNHASDTAFESPDIILF